MEISGGKKRLFFIGLFIVPFLIAMALIFYGKTFSPLPKYFEQKTSSKHKTYYQAPLQKFSLTVSDSVVSMKDSTTYVLVFFPVAFYSEWSKQILYCSEIIQKHKGCRLAIFFEKNDSLNLTPSHEMKSFIHSFPLVDAFNVPSENYEKLYSDFKISSEEVKANFSFPPYVIIDKSRIIRGMVPITDLKATREVVGRLKRLNNEYAAVKKTIEKR